MREILNKRDKNSKTHSEIIKEGSKAIHTRVETSCWARRLFDEKLSAEEFSAWLSYYYLFVSYCQSRIVKEGVLEASSIELPDRAFKIERSLKFLNHHPNVLKKNIHFSFENGWASLYLLEGSQLGSGILYRSLSRRNALPKECLEYYAGDVKKRFERWAKITAWIDSQTDLSPLKVTEQAVCGFNQLHSWMLQLTGNPSP